MRAHASAHTRNAHSASQALFTYLISLIILFGLFYQKAYVKREKGKAAEAKKSK